MLFGFYEKEGHHDVCAERTTMSRAGRPRRREFKEGKRAACQSGGLSLYYATVRSERWGQGLEGARTGGSPPYLRGVYLQKKGGKKGRAKCLNRRKKGEPTSNEVVDKRKEQGMDG